MFRALAQFQNQYDQSNQSDGFENATNPHISFVPKQKKLFDTLPHFFPSYKSGLTGFDEGIRTVDTVGQDYQTYSVKNPNDIFIPPFSDDLNNLSKGCATSTIDELSRVKDPNAAVGCGWMYSSPNKGSPYPLLSRGALGTKAGPIKEVGLPEYKKWFFDLQLAKKEIMLDKCKAMKACTDVDSEVFKGCGYCTDGISHGVPIDTVGRPLYMSDPRGNCMIENVAKTSGDCPPPPQPGSGPQPQIDRTCEPVNGRLSSACLYNQVLSGGCSDSGALAVALLTSRDPSNYVGNLVNSDAVKIYNRVANPPLNIDVFKQGNVSVGDALREVRNLSGNTTQSSTTAIGAGARDLCLKRGAIAEYDICSEVSDSTPPPFELKCLQSIFLKMGGQPKGKLFPSASNINTYNAMSNIGAVKQYLSNIISNMNIVRQNAVQDSFIDYNDQREAMVQILGIELDSMVKRAPYKQGVEVFWFMAVPGNPRAVGAFLRRTIEENIVTFNPGPSYVPHTGGVRGYTAALQMFDYRTPVNVSTKFRINVDDGFWVAANMPANIDAYAMSQYSVDIPGLFENLGMQGPTTYQSNSCTQYNANTPNITKLYWEDAGGGWHSFLFDVVGCNGAFNFNKNSYSLTCEERAPFINYEISENGKLEEVRNPGIFAQRISMSGLDIHTRTDEKLSVPGRKGFFRMNMNSQIDIHNICYQSWKSISFGIRFKSMPVKESLINLAMGDVNTYFYNVIATPINGSQSAITIEYNIGYGRKQAATPYILLVDSWYIFVIDNKDTGFNLRVFGINGNRSELLDGDHTGTLVYGRQLYKLNASWYQTPGYTFQACTILIGCASFKNWAAMYSTSGFSYDVAWIHFFDYTLKYDDIRRDCKGDWLYTAFPKAYNKY